jgi:hypothetical protein
MRVSRLRRSIDFNNCMRWSETVAKDFDLLTREGSNLEGFQRLELVELTVGQRLFSGFYIL